MSSNPLLPTEPTPSPADTQSVIDALGDQAGTVAAAALLSKAANMPADFPDPPKGTMSYSEELVRETFYKTWWAMVNLGAWRWLATVVSYVVAGMVGAFTIAVGIVTWAIRVIGIDLLQIGLGEIDQFRKALDPQVASVAVSVMNELLGTDFSSFNISTKESLQGHIDRSQEVGAMFHHQLISQYESAGTDLAKAGPEAAEKFTGYLMNFGVATALLGLTGELGSVGLLKDFRLIGEQVSSGLGLSRLHRLVMRPLMTTLIAQPYQWYLNKRFSPAQFKIGEVVNPFTGAVMSQDAIFAAGELDGYSHEKISELIKLHQKKLTTTDVALLERWKLWSLQQALEYIVSLGYDNSTAGTVLNIDDLHRVDARISRLIDKLEAQVDQGHMSPADALAIIEKLPVNGGEVDIIRQTFFVSAKLPHKSLTVGEVQSAFNEGLITFDDVTTFFSRFGYAGDDLSVLQSLTLVKFAMAAEAAAVAHFRYDQAVSKAKAKGLPIPPKPKILI